MSSHVTGHFAPPDTTQIDGDAGLVVPGTEYPGGEIRFQEFGLYVVHATVELDLAFDATTLPDTMIDLAAYIYEPPIGGS